jgi:hypothetical protein
VKQRILAVNTKLGNLEVTLYCDNEKTECSLCGLTNHPFYKCCNKPGLKTKPAITCGSLQHLVKFPEMDKNVCVSELIHSDLNNNINPTKPITRIQSGDEADILSEIQGGESEPSAVANITPDIQDCAVPITNLVFGASYDKSRHKDHCQIGCNSRKN